MRRSEQKLSGKNGQKFVVAVTNSRSLAATKLLGQSEDKLKGFIHRYWTIGEERVLCLGGNRRKKNDRQLLFKCSQGSLNKANTPKSNPL